MVLQNVVHLHQKVWPRPWFMKWLDKIALMNGTKKENARSTGESNGRRTTHTNTLPPGSPSLSLPVHAIEFSKGPTKNGYKMRRGREKPNSKCKRAQSSFLCVICLRTWLKAEALILISIEIHTYKSRSVRSVIKWNSKCFFFCCRFFQIFPFLMCPLCLSLSRSFNLLGSLSSICCNSHCQPSYLQRAKAIG